MRQEPILAVVLLVTTCLCPPSDTAFHSRIVAGELKVDTDFPGGSAQLIAIDHTKRFFFTTPRKMLSDIGRANLDRFLATCRLEMTGPLAYKGETHESGENYDKRWKFISKNWGTFHTAERVVSVTLETAWNTKHSTTDGYQAVGRQLGQAMERFFRADDSQAE